MDQMKMSEKLLLCNNVRHLCENCSKCGYKYYLENSFVNINTLLAREQKNKFKKCISNSIDVFDLDLIAKNYESRCHCNRPSNADMGVILNNNKRCIIYIYELKLDVVSPKTSEFKIDKLDVKYCESRKFFLDANFFVNDNLYILVSDKYFHEQRSMLHRIFINKKFKVLSFSQFKKELESFPLCHTCKA